MNLKFTEDYRIRSKTYFSLPNTETPCIPGILTAVGDLGLPGDTSGTHSSAASREGGIPGCVPGGLQELPGIRALQV